MVRIIFPFFLLWSLSITSLWALNEPDTLHPSTAKNISLTLLSGNEQFARAGRVFPNPVSIRIADTSNQALFNRTIHLMALDHGAAIEFPRGTDTLIYSDSSGMALFYPGRALLPGTFSYIICPEDAPKHTAIFQLNIRKKNWVFLLVIGLLGGLGLFLLGMSMMSEGMQNSAGNKLRHILSSLTQNRFVALGLGALVTMAIQSSSATNVMLVSFVNSKLMRFKQTIGVMLGAAIGTTITAQIIAFKLTDYALLFIALGLAIQYMVKKQAIKEMGKALLGFGILFFGMHIMSESMQPLRSYEPFLQLIMNMQNPVIGILVGALLTALIQSSSAFIGILIILSMQGLLTLGAAIPLLIGANIGTSITAILASLNGSREAKQVALAHTIFKIVGAVIILFFLTPFTNLIHSIATEPVLSGLTDSGFQAQPRQIANAHTIYNVALCLLFLPFTNLFGKFVTWIYPSREEAELPFQLRYIDEALLKAPIVAIDSARHELIRMMKKVYYMTEKIIHPFVDRDTRMLPEIEKAEKEINFLRDRIVEYLLKITQNTMAADIAEEAFIMMNAVREFEQIADVISHQLMEKAQSWCHSDYHFSAAGKEELVRYHEHTLAIIVQALKVYESFDLKAARQLKLQYNKYRKEYFEMEQQHYDRLKENIEQTQSSSKTHLEIITLLRVISSHATNTSRILLYKSDHKKIKKWPK